MSTEIPVILDAVRTPIGSFQVALGHPIGATGARMLTTLLYALNARSSRLGLVTACFGGGEAIAMLVERLSPAGS